MQITVSGKQVDLSDALRTRVAQQLDTIAGKYFDQALEAHVTFSRARSFFTCDINVHAGRGLTLRGEGEAADANSAFDDAAEHIAKRLRRYRRRVNDHARDLCPARTTGSRAAIHPAPGRGNRCHRGDRRHHPGRRLCHRHRRTAGRNRTAVGRRRGDAHGPRRPAGADVPQQHDRRIECGLSPGRWAYRVDRSDRVWLIIYQG